MFFNSKDKKELLEELEKLVVFNRLEDSLDLIFSYGITYQSLLSADIDMAGIVHEKFMTLKDEILKDFEK